MREHSLRLYSRIPLQHTFIKHYRLPCAYYLSKYKVRATGGSEISFVLN